MESWDSLKARPIIPVSQLVNANEKFLKKMSSATPVNTQMIRKQQSLIADVEKVWVALIEDQTSLNIPLSQSWRARPEQDSLQFCEGWERWGSFRREIWS